MIFHIHVFTDIRFVFSMSAFNSSKKSFTIENNPTSFAVGFVIHVIVRSFGQYAQDVQCDLSVKHDYLDSKFIKS